MEYLQLFDLKQEALYDMDDDFKQIVNNRLDDVIEQKANKNFDEDYSTGTYISSAFNSIALHFIIFFFLFFILQIKIISPILRI